MYGSRLGMTLTQSASEAGKLFPRLRFELVCDVSTLTGSGILLFGRASIREKGALMAGRAGPIRGLIQALIDGVRLGGYNPCELSGTARP